MRTEETNSAAEGPAAESSPGQQERPPAPPEISVLVYACNDQTTIRDALTDLTAAVADRSAAYEVIVADDASVDETAAIVEELAGADTRLTLVRNPAPAGYGATIRAGLAAAQYPWVLQVDGRNRLDLSALDPFLAERATCDMVIGRRRRHGGSLRRRAVYWLFRLFCRVVFGLPVGDVSCRMRLYRRESFDRIRIQSNGCFADAEILARAGFYELMIGEVPVSARPGALPLRDLRQDCARRTIREAWTLLKSPDFALPNLPLTDDTAGPPPPTAGQAP